MAKIIINQQWCKGCGLCIEICPKKVYTREANISAKGFQQIEIINPDLCNQCLLCELLCPDMAITIEPKLRNAKAQS